MLIATRPVNSRVLDDPDWLHSVLKTGAIGITDSADAPLDELEEMVAGIVASTVEDHLNSANADNLVGIGVELVTT